MDEFTKKKIEAINKEIDEHYKKVRELSNLKFKFEFQEDIEYANSLIGKYFRKSVSVNETMLFHPIEVSSETHQVRVIGFQAQEYLYLIGNRGVFIHSREYMTVDDIREYEEIEKEEFDTLLAEILDFDI